MFWLPLPSPAGFSRAVPLRFDPAFPAKAAPVPDHPPQKEWEAGLAAIAWTRQALDAAGRTVTRTAVTARGPVTAVATRTRRTITGATLTTGSPVAAGTAARGRLARARDG